MSTTEQQVDDTVRADPPVERDGEFAVHDPATGEIIAWVPERTPDEVREMVGRARAVQPAWEALGYEGRARVFKRAQKWVTQHSDELIRTIVSETGKAWEDAQIAEVFYGSAAFGFWADKGAEYLADEKVRTSAVLVKGKKLVVRYKPLGVIGVIGPWNYPLTNSFGDCIPALMAGNAVILKPSEFTPLTSLLLAEALKECGMPDGVLQIATGKGETGAALVDGVDMIMFTGSTATGKKIAKQAADTLTPVSLELGGKDAMIVLDDADLERAANHALYYAMFNGGQTCISVERVYVTEGIHDRFVARVVEKARELRQGVPTGPGRIDVGAMTTPEQVNIVERHVDDAREKGAQIPVGGHRRRGDGDFFEPTILTGVDHSMACMTEETFGPTLPIMKVRDAEEALRMANDSPYGLSGTVFTKDVAAGEQLARRMEAGAVLVNEALVNYTALELPMGGWKQSGIGTRHGAGGIRKYCAQQSVLVSKYHLRKDVHTYPYDGRTFKVLTKAIRVLFGRGDRG